MRITNKTDIPLSVVRDVLRFVAPTGVGGYAVELTRSKHLCRGRAWPWEWRVLLRVADATRFPSMGWGKHKGYLGCPPIGNEIEALVFIAAHELRHLWHYRVPRGYRVWGARGRYSERDADAYAIRKLREWRRRVPES